MNENPLRDTGEKFIIDDWKCPCCHTKGNFEYVTDETLICKRSRILYSRKQMKEIQGTGWVGEKHDQ